MDKNYISQTRYMKGKKILAHYPFTVRKRPEKNLVVLFRQDKIDCVGQDLTKFLRLCNVLKECKRPISHNHIRSKSYNLECDKNKC